MTTGPTIINRHQHEYWTREGQHWVREAERYDAMNGLFGEAMLARVALQPGERVLDVGCGNGATSLDAAHRVAPGGEVIGIDLSAAMLALARRRRDQAGCDNIQLLEVDAQVHPLEGGTFDAVISRFGTMFFDDPEAAFTNLHRALKPDGRLAMVCWQDMVYSEWIIVPGSAAAQHVGLPDFGPPAAPGPFAFADEQRLLHILEVAGFNDITIEAITKPMRIGDDADDTIAFIASLELVRDHLFADKPEDSVAAAVEAARTALAHYEQPSGVVMNGGAWLATGRKRTGHASPADRLADEGRAVQAEPGEDPVEKVDAERPERGGRVPRRVGQAQPCELARPDPRRDKRAPDVLSGDESARANDTY